MERERRTGLRNWTAVSLLVLGCLAFVLSGCPNPVGPEDEGGGEPPVFADVTALTATPGSGQVVLAWTDPADSGLDHITVTWSPGGTTPVEVAAGAGGYTATSLTNGVDTDFLVVATYAGGSSSGVHVSATPTIPPVADIVRTPAGMALVGEQIVFSGSGSTDADGTVADFIWNFDDGSAAVSGEDVAHAFAGAGTYEVALTVFDNHGASDTTTDSVYVNAPPIAVISADATSIETGQSVDFDSVGSTDSNGSIAGYAWDFGDGGTDTVADPAPHTYSAVGVYVAELTVTDNDGTSDTATVTIYVNDVVGGNVAPVADLSASATAVSVGESIDFDASGSTDSDGTITGYAWTFGDGGSSTAAATSHSYAASGTYVVGLVVTDNSGGTDATSVEISVNAPPTAVAIADEADPLVGDTVSFTGSGSSDSDGTIQSYAWDFGDGGTSTSADPTHVFAAVGTVTVTLTVTDDDGETDSDTVSINVHSLPPVAAAGPDQQVDVTESYVVDLPGSGTDPDGTIASYLWTFVSLPAHSDLTNGDIIDATTASASLNLGSEPFSSYPGDEWVYVLQLTVIDNDGETDTDQVQITLVGTAYVDIE